MQLAWAPHWPRGLAYLLLLGPFFFLSYGAVNHWAAAQAQVPSIVFDWEAHIPLLPWTILPYWSIDLFYGLSLLLATHRRELDRHAARLLSAQLLCVGCFALWPLKFSVARPPLDGWAGQLFDALTGFDLPYNQAPSLHIVLLLILWDFYRRRLSGWAKAVLHGWSALIALSVLTTYQHHFIDVPTGVLAGAVCLWLWPLDGERPRVQGHGHDGRWRLAGLYGAGALLCAGLAWWGGEQGVRAAWWLGWPAVALLWVALAYGWLGEAAFQKSGRGRHSVAVRGLLAPYRWLAWLNARCWTWRLPASVPVHGQVALGRLPLPWEVDHRHYAQVLDLTAELASRHPGVHSLPMLDLVVPQPARLLAAANHLQAMVAQGPGPVLVCCALGFSRSAAVVATWLCTRGSAASVDDALAMVRASRPQIVVKPALHQAIEAAVALGRAGGSASGRHAGAAVRGQGGAAWV